MVRVQLFFRGLLLAACTLVGAQVAVAEDEQPNGWSVCNHTSYVIESATGRAEGDGVVVGGWTRTKPGECGLLQAGVLTPGVHYLYSRSSGAHRGGRRVWGGEFPLCVDPAGTFSVESTDDCGQMGLEERKFRPVLIETRNRWTTTLTETEDYNAGQAQAAGIQRLLSDAGIFSGAIDGYIGSRTRGAIRSFLTSQNLSADLDDSDLIDVLEGAGKARAESVGLMLCNRTPNRIWSAIARRRGEGWQSRGWWLLESGGCARAIDEPLVQSEYYVYGEMEADGYDWTLKNAREPFCVSGPRFVVNGRQNCEASAYRTGQFIATPAPKDRKLVFEFFERDFDRGDTGE